MLYEEILSMITSNNNKMTVTASACDRVMMLPELLSTIFSCIGNDGPTLAACMRVNKWWAEEAVMYLWEACGGWFQDQGQLAPYIRNLAALASYPHRLQWYARCIRSLSFGFENRETEGMRDTPTDDSGDDAQYHPVFANTEFPRLASFRLVSSGYGSAYTRSSSLLPYLQASLLSFSLWEGNISDDLLVALRVRCHCSRLLQCTICPTDMF